jgi:hypothetical protein
MIAEIIQISEGFELVNAVLWIFVALFAAGLITAAWAVRHEMRTLVKTRKIESQQK